MIRRNVHRGGEAVDIDRRVRFHIYEHFTTLAQAPSTDDLATALDLPSSIVEQSLDRLAAAHAIALAPGARNIWMAHPFSAVPTLYPVRTVEQSYWANCAWDALGIPAMLGVDAECRTRCADCGEPLTLRVEDGRATPPEAVVHFVVPAKRFWENVGFT